MKDLIQRSRLAVQRSPSTKLSGPGWRMQVKAEFDVRDVMLNDLIRNRFPGKESLRSENGALEQFEC